MLRLANLGVTLSKLQPDGLGEVGVEADALLQKAKTEKKGKCGKFCYFFLSLFLFPLLMDVKGKEEEEEAEEEEGLS